MGTTRVERVTVLEHPAGRVYDWHTRPGAFERLTPPWEDVQLVRREGGLEDGAVTELRIRRGPATLTWLARHRDHVPGRQFTDVQEQGPFASWTHVHRFEPVADANCRMVDRIDYAAPLGPLGLVADELFLRSSVERMLRYRHATLAADLAAHARAGGAPLVVAVSGASGLVGRALRAFLTSGGHRVRALVRREASGPDEIAWNPAAGTIDAAALEGVDAVVHLAGENIAAGRWSDGQKAKIRESRVQGTALLARTLAGLARRPTVFVSASASGVYGDGGDTIFTEDAPSGTGFLADVGRAWEEATAAARDAGIRVVLPRFGIVLSPAGGALAKMLPAFQCGAGGRLGSGRQWMSWLSVDDAIGIIHQAVVDARLRGPVNAASPEPVTNAEFTAVLGRVLARPTVAAVPAAALRLLFGEMADATLLGSTRLAPQALERVGYPWRHAELEGALRHVMGR
ncbi:MAG: TIGR01777 family oxidoreductase [Gemmatimonadales bacterium]|nr:TIGR01777 family oxidoreductase [Gemmatimonadales bacterium]